MLNIKLSSGKYKSKSQYDTTLHQLEWLKLTRQETTNVSEDVEKGEHSYTPGRNASWYSHSENIMKVPQEVKNRATLGPSNFTTRYLPQRYK